MGLISGFDFHVGDLAGLVLSGFGSISAHPVQTLSDIGVRGVIINSSDWRNRDEEPIPKIPPLMSSRERIRRDSGETLFVALVRRSYRRSHCHPAILGSIGKVDNSFRRYWQRLLG